MKIESFSKGKNKERNEDCFGYNENTFVVVDGSTDKTGKKYRGKTGGEIISKIAVEKSLESSKTGRTLVEEINQELVKIYKRINPLALKENFYRFYAGFVCAKIKKSKIYITQIENVAFRISGKQFFLNRALEDEIVSNLRTEYIRKTKDIKGSRDFIMPLLKNELNFSNDSKNPLGFGAINGFPIPKKFIRNFVFDLKKVKTLEIFTDGYFDIPKSVSIKAWENAHKKVEKEDPYKYLKYRSTNTKDDRTVLIVKF